MNLDDIRGSLPNGFHDAELHRLLVDLTGAEVRLGMSVLVGLPQGTTDAEREAMRACTVRLSGVRSLSIEPPRPGYEFSDEGVDVDGGFGAYPGDPAPPDDGLVRLWFYVSTWNSRMLFTAEKCDLEW